MAALEGGEAGREGKREGERERERVPPLMRFTIMYVYCVNVHTLFQMFVESRKYELQSYTHILTNKYFTIIESQLRRDYIHRFGNLFNYNFFSFTVVRPLERIDFK